jgi:hypothetical protein
MNIQHRKLAQGQWVQKSFLEQMANIGGEVERALNWKAKNNPDYCRKAFVRALELLDLTLDDRRNTTRLRELARVREALADYFAGSNVFASTDKLWKKYFMNFAYACRARF